MTTSAAKDSGTATGKSPIVVDLGKKKKKQIKQLRKGHGKLMDEVSQVLHELKGAGKITGDAQPVVCVVRQKERTLRMPRAW